MLGGRLLEVWRDGGDEEEAKARDWKDGLCAFLSIGRYHTYTHVLVGSLNHNRKRLIMLTKRPVVVPVSPV